jgi:4-hydroxybenzoate polyprenyltransferase
LSSVGLYQEEGPTSSARVTHSHVASNSRLYRVIVHSALFLGLCVAAYTFAIMQSLQMSYDPLILVIAFLASYAPYNLNRAIDGKEDSVNNPERTNFVRKSRTLFLALIIGSYASILLIAIIRFNLSIFVVSLFPLTLVLLYTIKWIPRSGSKSGVVRRLKEILLVKNLVTATGWSGFIGMLIYFGAIAPSATTSGSISAPLMVSLLVFSLFIFARLIINTISCDLRDIQGDMESGVKTIPALLGYAKTIQLLILLNTVSLVAFSICAYQQVIPINFLYANIAVAAYCYLYLYFFSREINKNVLADVVVDGECIIPSIGQLMVI